MKKIITLLVAGCLLLLCACSPTQTPTSDPTQTPGNITQSPSSDPTQAPSEVPSEVPSETPSVAPSDAVIIQDFENGAVQDVISSLDWSGTSYGISNPILSITDQGTDVKNGFKVELADGNAWCQSFTIEGANLTSAFAQGGKYFRIWVNNQTEGTLGIGIELFSGNNRGYFGVANAKITGADGSAVKLETGDPSGMGQGDASAIIVPADFQGWLAFDTSVLEQSWSNPLIDSYQNATKITIDVRPSGFTEQTYYVFDQICLAETEMGQTRQWDNPNKEEENPVELTKKEQIAQGMQNAMGTTPQLHEMADFNPTGSFAGIKAYWFEGMEKNGKKTKVFAYVGFPAGASSSNKVPAIVLNHGGGGHAFLQWVKMWNDRGYAAIAIDNTGFFPTKVNAGSSETNADWKYGLPADLRENGYTAAPNNDGMGSSRNRVENMWMYHAAGQSILAANILRADERVDADKVGITGISWGGVITSIVIGYDTRFAFAIPIYGSGYLNESLAWMKDNFGGKETQELWLAQDNFDKVNMPVLWLCWNDDNCFSINSNSKSYLDTIKNNADTRLSMINKMMHSHGSGWNPGESMAFADSVVKNGAKLTGFNSQPSGKSINVALNVDASATKVSATLYYITEDMTYSTYDKFNFNSPSTYMDQVWQTAALTVTDNTVTGDVPQDAKGYYVEVKTTIGGKTYVTCSTYVTVE